MTDNVTISVKTLPPGHSDLWFELEGSDQAGDFQIKRSYLEFTTLQTLLQRRWPGFVIPHLLSTSLRVPPEHLRHSLELFMKALSELQQVYTASETQRFLRSPRAYTEIARDFDCSIYSIAQTYEAVLYKYYSQAFSQSLLAELIEFGHNLRRTEAALNQIKQKTSLVTQSHHCFEQRFLQMLGMVEAFGQEQVSENFEYVPVDEYTMISHWVDAELTDVRAVLVTLNRVLRLDEHRCKLLVEQERQQVAIAALREQDSVFAGNKKKACERKVQAMHRTIEEIRNASQVLNIAAQVLHVEELPRFKARKKARFQAMLASFSDFSMKYFQSLIEVLQFKFNQYLN